MELEFNLLDQPWIPVTQTDGRPTMMGLKEALLRSHNLLEISSASPLVVGSLHRLLLAIAHRVFGPADHGAWARLWAAGHWDEKALSAYFERWRSRFNLFDDAHPFYQCRNVEGGARKTNFFSPERASGNNAMLFDHHSDERADPLPAPEAARLLVAHQAFGLAGTSRPGENFTDGPWTRGSIFLVQGDTLFQTLMLNMILYPPADDILPTAPQSDKPIWEQDDAWADGRSIPHGYLDYLTWPSRRVLLKPQATADGIVVAELQVVPGLRLDASVLDPAKVYRIEPERGFKLVGFEEDKDLWRDSATLFRLSDDPSGQADRRPAAFRLLESLVARRVLDRRSVYRYMAVGMCNNRAKINFWRQERMPLPLAYFEDRELVGCLREEILGRAEAVGQVLEQAASELARQLLSHDGQGGSPDKTEVQRLVDQMAAERHYWSALEVPFRQAMETLPHDADGTQAEWYNTLRRAARDAFERAARASAAPVRAFKAVTMARGHLEAGLREKLPHINAGRP